MIDVGDSKGITENDATASMFSLERFQTQLKQVDMTITFYYKSLINVDNKEGISIQ